MTVADHDRADDGEDADRRVLPLDEGVRALEDRAADVLHRLGALVARQHVAGQVDGEQHGDQAGDQDDQLERARIHRAGWSSRLSRTPLGRASHVRFVGVCH